MPTAVKNSTKRVAEKLAKRVNPKKFCVPKSLAACADLLYQLREDRYAMQRQVDALAANEKLVKDYLIEKLPAEEASGITGAFATVQLEETVAPMVEDWGAVHAYIKKTGAFELLQRRLSDTAIKERWEHNKPVPGVGRMLVKKVSCTKKKGR